MLFSRKPAEAIEADTSAGIARALKHAAAKDPVAARERVRRIEQAIEALEAAAQGVDALSAGLDEARELAISAQDSASPAKRALIAERFNDIVEGLDEGVDAAGAETLNLIDGGASDISIHLEDANGAVFAVRGANLSRQRGGLSLDPAREAFAEDAEIEHALSQLARAEARLDGLAERFCGDAAFLTERLTFKDPS